MSRLNLPRRRGAHCAPLAPACYILFSNCGRFSQDIFLHLSGKRPCFPQGLSIRLILPVSWFSPGSRLACPIMVLESYGVPMCFAQFLHTEGLQQDMQDQPLRRPGKGQGTVNSVTDFVMWPRVSQA